MEKKENVNVEEKNVDINKSLMRKTKAELVNIILRKDDIETKLRKENKAIREDCIGTEKSLEEVNNNLKSTINKCKHLENLNNNLNKDLAEYKTDFENKCDELVDVELDNGKLEQENNKFKTVNLVLFVILIISLLFNIF